MNDHPTSACYVMPKTERTQGIKDDVAGIEAYLSLDFYRAAVKEIGLTVMNPEDPETAGWQLAIDKAEMGSRKQDLHKLLRDRNDPSDVARITELVPWISQLLLKGGQATLPI